MKQAILFLIVFCYGCQSNTGSEQLRTENDSLKAELTNINNELEHRNNIITELETAGDDEPDELVSVDPETKFKHDPSVKGTDIIKHFVSQLYINFPHKIDKEPGETWTQEWTTWAYSWKRLSTPVIYYYRWRSNLMGDGMYQSDPDLKDYAYSQKGIESFFGRSLDRSEAGLNNLFYTYKSALYTVITPKIYKETHLEKYVNTLLEVKEYLDKEHKGGKEFFNKLQLQEQSGKYINHMDYKLYKEIMSPSIGQEFMKSYYNKHEYYTGKDLVWFYSFWNRRTTEDNAGEVKNILKEIKQHYDKVIDDSEEVEGC